MKVPGSFKAILDTGQQLIDKGINVRLAIPYMDFNKHELTTSMRFFVDRGFSIGGNPFKVITRSNDTPEIRAMISEDFYREVFAGNSCVTIEPDENADLLCRGRNESIMVDIHGGLHPCVAFRNFVIGSIFEELPLNEILQRNETYRSLKNLSKKDLVCGTCEHRRFCNPCLAQWHTLNGSFNRPHPQNCNMTKAYLSQNQEKTTNDKLSCGSF
jgi:radical SAM protein with 4Fe4S-binding SPASM domain